MSNQEWDNASTNKKLEMRKDIVRIYDIVSRLVNDVGAVHGTVRANDSLLKEVARAVGTIEKRLPKESKNKK
jgi:hypothetical protein